MTSTNPPVVLITGANQGIGLEVAKELAQRELQVILTSRNVEKGQQAVSELKSKGLKVTYHQLDVGEIEDIKDVYSFIEEKFGHLDVLINNAGGNYDTHNNILTIDPAEIIQTIQTNALGAFNLTQKLWPLLLKSVHGRVVNVSSGSGQLTGKNSSYAPAYSISKTTLNMITQQFAIAGRHENTVKIAVNSVCPGWVRTSMGGQNAPRNLEEGADTIVWLATEADQSLTGTFLRDKQPIAW